MDVSGQLYESRLWINWIGPIMVVPHLFRRSGIIDGVAGLALFLTPDLGHPPRSRLLHLTVLGVEKR
jgi:hypothetical protein